MINPKQRFLLEVHRTHKRQILKPLAVFEPAITAKQQPDAHVLESAATGIWDRQT
jgi:hypothetical protein